MAICATDFTLPDFAYHTGDLVTLFTYVVEFQDNWIAFAAICAGVLIEVLRKAHVQSG